MLVEKVLAQSASSTEIAQVGVSIINVAWTQIKTVFTDPELIVALVLLGVLMFVLQLLLPGLFNTDDDDYSDDYPHLGEPPYR